MAASTTPKKSAESSPKEPLRLGLGSSLRWTLRDVEPAKSCRLLVTATAELGLDLVQIADNVALCELEVPSAEASGQWQNKPVYISRSASAHTAG